MGLGDCQSQPARMDPVVAAVSPIQRACRMEGGPFRWLGKEVGERNEVSIDPLPIDKLYMHSWPGNPTFCPELSTC